MIIGFLFYSSSVTYFGSQTGIIHLLDIDKKFISSLIMTNSKSNFEKCYISICIINVNNL